MAGLNVTTYLTAYLDACGRNSGKPRRRRTSNGSCPGTPARLARKPGASRHGPADTGTAGITPAPTLSTGHNGCGD